MTEPNKNALFSYFSPLQGPPKGIISIPHSGEEIPEIFKPYLSGNEDAYLEDTDYKVHELIDIPFLQSLGIAVLVAKVQRICVDLNRSENQALFFWKKNTKGQTLVKKEVPEDVEREILDQFYHPYFEFLKAIIEEVQKQQPEHKVPVIDLHSMPSRATAYHMKQNPHQKEQRPDFCLSDRRGKTCDPEFINSFHQGLKKRSFFVTQNDPYVGGYLTEFIDRFNTNNIQIEINRSLYMIESSKKMIPDGQMKIKKALTEIIGNSLLK